MVDAMDAGIERRAIRIRGIVQGVGFRPAMFRLADELGLAGFVRNDREGVWLEIEGEPTVLDRFVAGLPAAAPPASRIDAVEVESMGALDEHAFRIAESPPAVAGRDAAAAIPADLAPCADCLRELTDPADRRYRYPFINCISCGPRFTIVRDVPYDRAKTTMATFAMCSACVAEYEDPRVRRFHAEPNACPECGPKARLVGGDPLEGDAAVRAAAGAVAAGAIVAVKGAGGFVLAVDATNEVAVQRLRERKRRPHKPFAVMGRSLTELARIARLDDASRALITAPTRPIVLVPARGGVVAPSVAPGLGDLGVYLPPTPLQHLLLADGPALQVMTSGNLAEEPIARTDAEAIDKLAKVADLFLVHDREVHARADDSVVRTASRGIPMRRARGFVPAAIELGFDGPPVLAVGGHERNTVCLAAGGKAVLSQHVGDLDHVESMAFFLEAVAHLAELVGAKPELVVHDLHPDYQSTRWARASGLPAVAVQHHHAHVAACLAEHGRTDRVIGIAFDGTGLGDDGTLWGGEILEADLATSRRRGRLRPLKLAGGEAAIKHPWRLAAAALIDAGEPLDILGDHRPLRQVAAVLATSIPPRASGAGRWFDAVASLLGVADDISYDGQAAAQLEAIAAPGPAQPLGLVLGGGDLFELDLRPAIREIARELRRGTPAPVLAARFHATLAHGIRAACRWVDAGTVVLTGGCFQNRRLLDETLALLAEDGRDVLTHQHVPPNDGGIARGQAAIASFQRSPSCA
jgi:hydrogenase maturation protein HypF